MKVGDFGLAEDMYARGYVREDSKTVKFPYKWMPPESLEDGLFSQQSDVVCYAGLRILNNTMQGNFFLIIFCNALPCTLCPVVIWCNLLGDIHSWQDPLPSPGPTYSTEDGERGPSSGVP